MTTEFNRLESISDPEEYKAKSVLDLMSLKGKVTVVTGAARGIGLGIARGAAELGSDVAILDILEQPAEDLKSWEGLGVRVKYYRTDVTKPEALATVFESINEDFGRIDNCVTAAGIVIDKPFLDHEWEESMKVLNINVMGSILCAQLAAKYMRKQSQGSIVMLGSTAAHGATPSRNMAVYSASKGAIISLTRSLAVELAQFGIRVNSVSPGFIATEMILDATRKDPDLWKSFNSTPPLQRVGTRGDLKGIVACLLTDAAAYTTGADIAVDGGLSSGKA